MPSTVPIVRQIAWISVVPQLALMALFTGAAYLGGLEPCIVVGPAACLTISSVLRRLIPRDQRAGMALFRREKFEQALPHFERSYEFFTRHRWLDDWRYLILFSSSRISYREMALLNIAFCYSQIGQGLKSREYYYRVAQEFPGSRIAEAALRMYEEHLFQLDPEGYNRRGELLAKVGITLVEGHRETIEWAGEPETVLVFCELASPHGTFRAVLRSSVARHHLEVAVRGAPETVAAILGDLGKAFEGHLMDAT